MESNNQPINFDEIYESCKKKVGLIYLFIVDDSITGSSIFSKEKKHAFYSPEQPIAESE